ncbi:MAG: lysozyme inhibitor LprI family protein [Campylobacteraceae bacterium]|jgi:uncharacterized protein YecT (DUF1311 family)|nr:lysozyme inhibitor LprI family protein [Campylobacteraceae bacterium]
MSIAKLIYPPLTISVAAFAQDCNNAQTQTELNICTDTLYKNADKELNNIYSSYRATLDKTQKEALKNAQTAWIKYRDLSCAFEASSLAGDSAYAMVLNQCLAKKTKDRTEEIKELFFCEEGNIACPNGEK